MTSLGRGADGGGGISVAAARRVAAEVRALLALDGTGGAVPSDDDDDDDDDASRALFPRLHDFYLVTGSPSAPSHPVESHLVTTMCAGGRDLRAYIRAARADRRVGLPESQAVLPRGARGGAPRGAHARVTRARRRQARQHRRRRDHRTHLTRRLRPRQTVAKPSPNDRQTTAAKRPSPNDHRQTSRRRRDGGVRVAGARRRRRLPTPRPTGGRSPSWRTSCATGTSPSIPVTRVASTHQRVCFPPPTRGGPSPGVSEDMKGMIVAMTRRPVAAATDRLSGWSGVDFVAGYSLGWNGRDGAGCRLRRGG